MRLRSFFRRATIDREMRDEMELHLERAVDRLIARGLSPEAAAFQARREFGNLGVLHEDARDARGARWIESVAGDIRFALRHFGRKPLMTATIVLVLSLGIGVHAGVFSLIQSITLRPPPGVPDDPALVVIRGKEKIEGESKWMSRLLSYPEFREFGENRDVFSSVAGWSRHYVALDAGDGEAGSSGQVQFVTNGFFSTIGIRPVLGPGLPATDGRDAGDPELVAVIGHALWLEAFASSPGVLGKVVRVNDVAVRIVGVAPPRFNGAVPTTGRRTLWMPLSARAAIRRTNATALASRDSAMLETVGRLRRGVTVRQADAAVRVIDARSAALETLDDRVKHEADVVSIRGDVHVIPSKDTIETIAFGELVSLLILLITCTNVSALVVGSAVARRHEIAVRLSLGASRARLIRQLLTESSLLAMAGGALGLLVYWWVAKALASQMPKQDIVPDVATTVFTMVFAIGTGILFGLSPALHATGHGAATALKDSVAGVTSRSRLQRAFVVAQIALTQPLLVGLGVTMVFAFVDSERRVTTEIALRAISIDFNRFGGVGSHEAQAAQLDGAMQQVAALPGVVGVIRSPTGYQPLELVVAPADRGPLPRSSRPVDARFEATTPGFFDLFDISIVRGRALVAADTLSVKLEVRERGGMRSMRQVAVSDVPVVIGSDLAHELWGNEDAIGRRFERNVQSKNTQRGYFVVGVYDSERGLTTRTRSMIYGPMNESFMSGYLIRTAGPAAPLLATVRSVVQGNVPQAPINRLETIAEREEASRAEGLNASRAAGAGGILALVLASIGLYGVIALALGQRRREIGVRVALGARPRQVVGMFLASGLRLCVLGLLIGLPLSVVAMKIVAAEITLPGVNIPLVGAGIGVVVVAVATVATWLPARHAATVDPMIALRAD